MQTTRVIPSYNLIYYSIGGLILAEMSLNKIVHHLLHVAL